MTRSDDVRIGSEEARWLIRRIVKMTDPDRQALRAACAAKCPLGKNKRQARTETLRRAA